MKTMFLGALLSIGGSLTPLCCWAKLSDVAVVTDTLDFQLRSAEACVGTGQVNTGTLGAHTNRPGWTITAIDMVAVIDGREVPPPIDLYSNTAGVTSVHAGGTSATFASGVRDTIEAALDDGGRHAFAARITVHMKDDQGDAQAESFTTSIGT
jgi:hypothetical protein